MDGHDTQGRARYAGKVDKLFPGSRELFDAEKSILDLKQHEGWRIVLSLLAESRESLNRLRDFGPIVSQAEYAQMAGQAQGLIAAEQAVDAVLSRAREKRAKLEKQALRDEQREPIGAL